MKLSFPTRVQLTHSLERVLLVFITVGGGYWLKTPNPLSKDALTGAAFAGATAVYQLVLNVVTTR